MTKKHVNETEEKAGHWGQSQVLLPTVCRCHPDRWSRGEKWEHSCPLVLKENKTETYLCHSVKDVYKFSLSLKTYLMLHPYALPAVKSRQVHILIQTTPSTIHTQHGSRRWYLSENPNNFGGKYLPIKIFECRPLLYGQRMMYGDGPSQNTPFVNIQKVIRSAMLRSGTWHAWTNNSIPSWGNRKEPCPSFEI